MVAKKRSSKKSKSTAYKFSVHVKKPKGIKKKTKRKISKKLSKGKKSWVGCVAKARKELGVKGFVAIKKGTPLYKINLKILII